MSVSPARLLALLAPVLLATWTLTGAVQRLVDQAESPYPLSAPEAYNEARAHLAPFERDIVPRDVSIAVPARLERGETLGRVFTELGLEPLEAERAVQAAEDHLDPRRLRAGTRYAAHYSPDGEITAVSLDLRGKGRLRLRRRERSQWSARWSEFEEMILVRRVEGSLRGSLESSLRAAGAPGALAYRMADVLQWDLDFNRDLRAGDRFSVLWEEVHLEGSFHRIGEILALVYENLGERLEAYRYGEGHYDARGRPLRRLFLRSPLQYSRITSRFRHRRFHPVLKTYRPHYGVDYGAPVGTPVRATANGIVASARWSKEGGKTVKIRHPNDYLTAYLHLSRYGEGVASGRRVRQGDIVGYVGATGLATGPHLDYRVQHRGRWINPGSLRNEPAPPIPEDEKKLFLARRDSLREELHVGASSGPDAVLTAAAWSPSPSAGLPAGGS